MGIRVYFMPKDEETIIVIAAVIIVLLFIGVMFLLALFYFNNKKRRLLEEKRHREAAYAEELLKTRLEIQETTLRHISQEIHDNFAQTLGLVKLTMATANPHQPEQVSGALLRSKELVAQVIQAMRQLSHSLSPDCLEHQGLQALIAQQLQQLEKTNQYTTKFTVNGYAEQRNLQKEMMVLRIVQELLNNIVKHAKATSISIDMAFQQDQLTIAVKDNGVGFDNGLAQSTTAPSSGLGSLNLQKRIQMIDGSINITSSPGNGTKVVITVPYE